MWSGHRRTSSRGAAPSWAAGARAQSGNSHATSAFVIHAPASTMAGACRDLIIPWHVSPCHVRCPVATLRPGRQEHPVILPRAQGPVQPVWSGLRTLASSPASLWKPVHQKFPRVDEQEVDYGGVLDPHAGRLPPCHPLGTLAHTPQTGAPGSLGGVTQLDCGLPRAGCPAPPHDCTRNAEPAFVSLNFLTCPYCPPGLIPVIEAAEPPPRALLSSAATARSIRLPDSAVVRLARETKAIWELQLSAHCLNSRPTWLFQEQRGDGPLQRVQLRP